MLCSGVFICRKRLLIVAILGCGIPILQGQNLSVGLVGGFGPGDDFQTTLPPSTAGSNARYLVGPSIGIGIASGFSFEFDALYHPLRFPDSPGSVITWEF